MKEEGKPEVVWGDRIAPGAVSAPLELYQCMLSMPQFGKIRECKDFSDYRSRIGLDTYVLRWKKFEVRIFGVDDILHPIFMEYQ
jgi:hypothetical protein